MAAPPVLDAVIALTDVERRLRRSRRGLDALEREAMADALAGVKSLILRPPPPPEPPEQTFVAAVIAARRTGLGGVDLVHLFNEALEGGLS
jgi:hypothetical protein